MSIPANNLKASHQTKRGHRFCLISAYGSSVCFKFKRINNNRCSDEDWRVRSKCFLVLIPYKASCVLKELGMLKTLLVVHSCTVKYFWVVQVKEQLVSQWLASPGSVWTTSSVPSATLSADCLSFFDRVHWIFSSRPNFTQSKTCS